MQHRAKQVDCSEWREKTEKTIEHIIREHCFYFSPYFYEIQQHHSLVFLKEGKKNRNDYPCAILFFLQIILTIAEHHSAIVPWQLVAQKTGAILKFVSLNQDEAPDVDNLRQMFSRKTKIVVVHHVSNTLGMFLYLESLHFNH